ncbi:hypothetical protein H0H92_006632 [Tricholoma furcatifolium]|nr:hypothetical protein H0H92_006632 [Tricholoma furcatifolium]
MGRTPKRKHFTHRKKVSCPQYISIYFNTNVYSQKSTATAKASLLANESSPSAIQPVTTTATPSSITSHLTTPTPVSRTTLNDDELFWNPPRRPHDSDRDSSSEEDGSPPPPPSRTSPHTPTTADRIRITRKNAAYDLVVGAMRGSKTLEIPRTKPLRDPIDDIARNTRRVNRIITDIIMRCERLGEETGCWLLFLAQLPSSKALTHYSSSRLRREAKSDTLRLINQYQTLIRTLLAAKRDEAVSIQKRFEETQRDLESIRRAKVAMEAEMALKDAELAKLRGTVPT